MPNEEPFGDVSTTGGGEAIEGSDVVSIALRKVKAQCLICLQFLVNGLPKELFHDLMGDVNLAVRNYGPLDAHDNEQARSRFITTVSIKVLHAFELI